VPALHFPHIIRTTNYFHKIPNQIHIKNSGVKLHPPNLNIVRAALARFAETSGDDDASGTPEMSPLRRARQSERVTFRGDRGPV
jgi:hypothetical protein